MAITDDLGAGAVRSGYSVPKAAVAALAAGSDLIRIDSPEDQAGVQEAIVAAVESGELDEARLRQAAARIAGAQAGARPDPSTVSQVTFPTSMLGYP